MTLLVLEHPLVSRTIELVWARIEAHAGEQFLQKRGGEFNYEVRGSSLIPDWTNRTLPRSDFDRALQRVPLGGPGEIQQLQGPSYIYAIPMDPRIRQHDW